MQEDSIKRKRDTSRKALRNEKIKERFNHWVKAEPKWRMEFIFKELEKEFFLSADTLERIVKN
jgi:hypothetical protein